MPKVVVLGAGIGGVPMAFELRERLGGAAQIDVVSESEWFQFNRLRLSRHRTRPEARLR